jgi:type II secretory pathway component PulJ
MRTERGTLLLEALLALVVVATVSVAALAGVHEALLSEQRHLHGEESMASAERLMTEAVLLDRGALEQRIGMRRVGSHVLSIQRPRPTLFRVAVADTAHPEREELVTLLYRPLPE